MFYILIYLTHILLFFYGLFLVVGLVVGWGVVCGGGWGVSHNHQKKPHTKPPKNKTQTHKKKKQKKKTTQLKNKKKKK